MLLLAVFIGVSAAVPVRAQTFGQYAGARTLPPNGHAAGAYMDMSSNLLAVMGQLRFSFYPDVDFGFQGGLGRYDLGGSDVTTARLGADFKLLAAKVSNGAAIDLSFGAGIGLESGEDFSQLSLGPLLTGSCPIVMARSFDLEPYVSIGALFSRVDAGATDANDVSFPVRLGTEIPLMPGTRAVAELRLRLGDAFNDNVGVGFGANFDF